MTTPELTVQTLEPALISHARSWMAANGSVTTKHGGKTPTVAVEATDKDFWIRVDVLATTEVTGAAPRRVYDTIGRLQVSIFAPRGLSRGPVARVADKILTMWRAMTLEGLYIYRSEYPRWGTGAPDVLTCQVDTHFRFRTQES